MTQACTFERPAPVATRYLFLRAHAHAGLPLAGRSIEHL